MKRLLDAPHRIFFFAAAVQIVLVSAWCAATLAARASGHAGTLPAGLAPAAVHALLMIYGFFPLFIFGFLFTAGPRWLDLPAPARADYAAPAILATAGAWMMLPAFLLGPVAAANALLAPIVAWTWLLARFVRMIVASRAPDRTHAILAASALGCAVAGLFAARLWLLTGSPSWATVMEAIGIWGFLVPLVAAVSHRMIPFFTASAIPLIPPWRPGWTLAVIAGAAYAHGVLAVADLARWTWVVDLPAGVLATYLAWRWGPRAVSPTGCWPCCTWVSRGSRRCGCCMRCSRCSRSRARPPSASHPCTRSRSASSPRSRSRW
jgi:uncharacterized protein involved in response to NO